MLAEEDDDTPAKCKSIIVATGEATHRDRS